MDSIYVAGIVYGSMLDGPGLRTVIFLCGCSVGCPGCHNKEYWNKFNGKKYSVKELYNEILPFTPQKKITFSGGEPLEQKKELKKFINLCVDFDLGLYTSYEIDYIDKDILSKLSFVKTGKFMKNLAIKNEYYGSSNQKLIYLQ